MVLLLGIPHAIPLIEQISIFSPQKITITVPGTMRFVVLPAWENRGRNIPVD